MLWQLVLVVVLVWILRTQWKRRDLRKVSKYFKSDFQYLPLLGHAHHLFGGGEARMKAIQSVGRQAIKYGGWTWIQLGPRYFACVADVEEAEYIMKTHLEKDDVMKVSRAFTGNGTIFAPVPIWKLRRKVLTPTFNQQHLNMFVDEFYKQSSIMVDILEKEISQEPLSMWQYLSLYAMDSVCETTFGAHLGVQKKRDHIFLHSFKQYAEIIIKRVLNPWLTNELSFKILCYFGMYQKYAKSMQIISKFASEIIFKKRLELKVRQTQDPTQNTNDGISEKSKLRPILELLIEASGGDQGYTNIELQEETKLLLLAATDTTAVGAAFLTLMIAKYPDVQEKLYTEIREVIGDRPIKPDDLRRLCYLEAVVKETLRMYPPVPVTARKIEKDCVTPGGVKLVAGLGIGIHHWGINRNPKYWGEDAEVFRPERFFDSPPKHPAAFSSFSYGPRNCIGYKYAMMSMMTVTACLVRRYRILPADPEEIDTPLQCTYEIMMKHTNNFKVRIEPRI